LPRPGDAAGRASDSDESGSVDSLLHGVVIRLLDPDELLRIAAHVRVVPLGEFPEPPLDLALGRGRRQAQDLVPGRPRRTAQQVLEDPPPLFFGPAQLLLQAPPLLLQAPPLLVLQAPPLLVLLALGPAAISGLLLALGLLEPGPVGLGAPRAFLPLPQVDGGTPPPKR
jgi:hypothetical protein